MNIVIFHNGSILGKYIIKAWRDKHRQTSDFHLVRNCSLDALEVCRPDLVILASDTPSAFEHSVLEKCRNLKLSTLSVLGRGATVLLGPLEIPEMPGCSTCLQLRWENTFHRSLLISILGQPVGSIVESEHMPLTMSHSDLRTLGNVVIDDIQSMISVSPNASNFKGKAGVYEQAESIEWVPLVPSHDCPRCNLMPDDDPALAQLQFASHIVHNVETLRVGTVDYAYLESVYINTKAGYISAIDEFWTGDRYVEAGAYIYTPAGTEIVGHGSGLSIMDAKQSAMLEVLERSCGYQAVNRHPVVYGKYSDFNDIAVHPAQFGLHSQALFQTGNDNYEPYAEENPYSWIWAHSTKLNQSVLIP